MAYKCWAAWCWGQKPKPRLRASQKVHFCQCARFEYTVYVSFRVCVCLCGIKCSNVEFLHVTSILWHSVCGSFTHILILLALYIHLSNVLLLMLVSVQAWSQRCMQTSVYDEDCRLGRDPQRGLNTHETFDCRLISLLHFAMNKRRWKLIAWVSNKADVFDFQAILIAH